MHTQEAYEHFIVSLVLNKKILGEIEYCLFRMLALSFGALKRRPLSFSGEIPVLIFRRDLILDQNVTTRYEISYSV